jgi:uncharacterized Tic20 family protein
MTEIEPGPASEPGPPVDPTQAPAPQPGTLSAREMEVRQWASFIHFSMLIASFVGPLIIWQVKKVQYPELDVHGKAALNFCITLFICVAVSMVLVFVFIGIFMLLAIAVLGIVFPIIAGIKASNGEQYTYPIAIPFLK